MIDAGANKNIVDELGNSALLIACAVGSKECAQILLRKGARVNH